MRGISSEIISAAQALSAGELVGFPTETVYGLGADATNDRAVAKIYAVKARPQFNPLIVHVATLAQAYALGQFSPAAQNLAEQLWPGPLTLVVPQKHPSPISSLATVGQPTVAIRIPAHPVALALLETFGRPLVAPSANPSGKLSPTQKAHVEAGLGGKVKIILEGGPSRVGVESTIISLINEVPVLLRAGGITREKIEYLLGQPLNLPVKSPLLFQQLNGQQAHIAPGQLESHYAPHAQLRLNAEKPFFDEVYIGFGTHQHGEVSLSVTGNLEEAASNLFRLLHLLDTRKIKKIALAPIPEEGLGLAINDRLRRAAAPRN